MQPPDDARYRTFRPDERPDVLVTLDEGDEAESELRAWKRGPEGWVSSVQWRRGQGRGPAPVTSPLTGSLLDERQPAVPTTPPP